MTSKIVSLNLTLNVTVELNSEKELSEFINFCQVSTWDTIWREVRLRKSPTRLNVTKVNEGRKIH